MPYASFRSLVRALGQELSDRPFVSVGEFDDAYDAHIDWAFDTIEGALGQQIPDLQQYHAELCLWNIHCKFSGGVEH
jgi:hypothetical protein